MNDDLHSLPEVVNARRALAALALELPASIHRDVTLRIESAFAAIADQAKRPAPDEQPYPYPCTICGADLVKTADDEILPARYQRRNDREPV